MTVDTFKYIKSAADASEEIARKLSTLRAMAQEESKGLQERIDNTQTGKAYEWQTELMEKNRVLSEMVDDLLKHLQDDMVVRTQYA